MIEDGQVTEHAKQIWWAGVNAARADRLIESHVRTAGNLLHIGKQTLPGDSISRLALVGAGKAAEAMAYGFLTQTEGWLDRNQVNLCGQLHIPNLHPVSPTDDTPILRNFSNQQLIKNLNVLPLRPYGLNQTSQPIVEATQRLLRLVKNLGPGDVVVSLISGGGSALLCHPVEGLTVEDQITVTRTLSESGASIQQLNTLRRCIDQVKCGGLKIANHAEYQFALVLSDVIGDDLSTIASGPNWVTDRPYQKALDVLQKLELKHTSSENVTRYLRSKADSQSVKSTRSQIPHTLVGNTRSGVEAASRYARALGYQVIMEIAEQPERLSAKARQLIATIAGCQQPTCIVSGGEPTLNLAPLEQRGIGGRNQQMALEALREWSLRYDHTEDVPDFCLLSAGTDGEDGPSQSAGGFCNRQTLRTIQTQKLDLQRHIDHNDAERLLRATDNLFYTGTTHTNICDIRVFIALPK